VEIIGPCSDVELAEVLPAIYNALEINQMGTGSSRIHLIAEVQQHLGDNKVARGGHGTPPTDLPAAWKS